MPVPQEQVVDYLKLVLHNVTAEGHQEVPAERKKAIKDQSGTLAVGERVHLNCTPSLNGKEYPGQSPEARSWTKEDGTSPAIEYRWGSGDREFSNSGNDPFHLGSYQDQDNGWTPTLTLTEQIGSGRNQVWVVPYIRPEYNGGVGVEGQAIFFFAD